MLKSAEDITLRVRPNLGQTQSRCHCSTSAIGTCHSTDNGTWCVSSGLWCSDHQGQKQNAQKEPVFQCEWIRPQLREHVFGALQSVHVRCHVVFAVLVH